jgi:hypothetical protein
MKLDENWLGPGVKTGEQLIIGALESISGRFSTPDFRQADPDCLPIVVGRMTMTIFYKACKCLESQEIISLGKF